jgi:hypothetical protein
MFKSIFNLRNMVKKVAILAVFSLFAGNVLAQTFNYTDASGVTATYSLNNSGNVTFPNGITMPTVSFADAIIDAPAGLTKWVLPETITHEGVTYCLYDGVIHGAGYDDGHVFANLTELVLPKYMRQFQSFANVAEGFGGTKQFPALRTVTFGEYYQYFSWEDFQSLPLESVIFKGTAIFYNTTTGKTYGNQYQTFGTNPSTTEIIIPCGTRALFELSITNNPNDWNNGVWTAANLVEAECLNTLTVLSNDVNLGNAISMSGGTSLTSTTPDNTSAEFSGTATLYALPQGGKLFVGWSDGNLENPRTVTVAADVTLTAQFATCSNTGVEEVRAASAGIRVYPNPAGSEVNVALANEVAAGTLSLFDMNGKVVLSQPISGSAAQINLSALASGNYVLRLVENGMASAGVQVIKK